MNHSTEHSPAFAKVLMIAPALTAAVFFVASTIVEMIITVTNPTQPHTEEGSDVLIGVPSPEIVAAHDLLLKISGIVALIWIPCLIIGLILIYRARHHR